MAVGAVLVSCLVLTTALVMSNTTGRRSAMLGEGTPGPAAVAAVTMAVKRYVVPLYLEGVYCGCQVVAGSWKP